MTVASPEAGYRQRRRCERGHRRTDTMLKILGWAILIIFIIGLLVVTGILKLIF
jgi:hypothetical protein